MHGGKNHPENLKKMLVTLDIGSHSNAVRSGRSVVVVEAQCGQLIVASSFSEESLHVASLKTKVA
jgi:hypothetical protein